MATPTNNKIKELLDRLATESWQLELLISGFVIFLVGGSFDAIYRIARRARVVEDGLEMNVEFLSLFPVILLGCALFVFLNLILHVVFRGMWISAIGLRSISGEIDFEELRFKKPFDNFLKRKLGSFDNFIQRLEDISSVIFSFTFLIIFMVISIAFFFFFMLLLVYLIDSYWNDIPETLEFIPFGLVIILLLFGFLYFLDFLTLGFFKRKRWLAVWYFPIYRLMSIITFSWLYRPLYYNLVDNRFGRKVGLLLVPYFITVLLLATSDASINKFIPEKSEALELQDHYYDDTRDPDRRIITLSIPSKYVDNRYLELFLVYNALNDDPVLDNKFPEFNLEKKIGYYTDIKINVGGEKETPKYTPADSLLYALSTLYEIKIDTVLYPELEFFFYENNNYGEQGIKTIIDLDSLARGKHVLNIQRLSMDYDSLNSNMRHYATVPFWIE